MNQPITKYPCLCQWSHYICYFCHFSYEIIHRDKCINHKDVENNFLINSCPQCGY